MGVPQIIFIILTALGIFNHFILHGKRKPETECYYDFRSRILNDVFVFILLIWGGFFS